MAIIGISKHGFTIVFVAIILAIVVGFVFLWGSQNLWNNRTEGSYQINITPHIPSTLPTTMGVLTNNNTYLHIATYDGSAQVVHPCVIYTNSGWNGYNYLMVMTPYPHLDSKFENPSMRYSNDGFYWEMISGQPDPIIAKPSAGFLSDPNIELVNGTLYLFFRYANTENVSNSLIYYNYTTTTNGIDWTPQVRLNMAKTRSSSFLHNGTGWESWGHNITTGNLSHFTSNDLVNWTQTGTTLINTTTFDQWHSEVKLYDGQYQLLMSDKPYENLRFYTSSDGLTWKFENYNSTVLSGRTGMWDSRMYKSSFVKVNNTYKVWYSAFNALWVAKIAYTEYL
jgi:hypothetical protein